jgi:hypothetical protein
MCCKIILPSIFALSALCFSLSACATQPGNDMSAIAEKQTERCWNVPIGGPDPANRIVKVIVDVNPDRTAAHVTIVDNARYNSDPYFHTAADAVVHAILNPKCNPLPLPPAQYENWKQLPLTFDPRDML